MVKTLRLHKGSSSNAKGWQLRVQVPSISEAVDLLWGTVINRRWERIHAFIVRRIDQVNMMSQVMSVERVPPINILSIKGVSTNITKFLSVK